MQIRYKGLVITRRRAHNNIVKVYDQAGEDDKYDWYSEAQEFARTELSQVELNKAIGVLSALSPMKRWNENKRIAKLFIEGHRAGMHTTLFKDKAQAILDCDGSDEAILAILSGKKIKSFYLNIRYPKCPKNVTIDRHAVSIALGKRLSEDETKMSPKQYDFFRECYRYTAEKLGLSPVQLQAVTWVTWRKN